MRLEAISKDLERNVDETVEFTVWMENTPLDKQGNLTWFTKL